LAIDDNDAPFGVRVTVPGNSSVNFYVTDMLSNYQEFATIFWRRAELMRSPASSF
jgi:hypothetical protein